MKDVKQDLEDRLALLRVRYEVAFHAQGTGSPVGPLAASLELGLHAEFENAVKMVHAVIDPDEHRSAEFWRTPLGVLLFAAGGYTDDAVTQTVAAGVLHCSRQYVNELVVQGKLLSIEPPVGSTDKRRLVEAAGVRRILKRKLDRMVK